jgi:hypothetical protein
MILISEDTLEGVNIKYYNGIDLKIALEHPKDGSGGFIFCFVDKWVSEVRKYNRESKIDDVLGDGEFKEFDSDELNNNYICIYQTDGNLEPVYNAIKGNIHKKIGKPWLLGDCIRSFAGPELGKIPTHKFGVKKGNPI